MKRHPIPTRAFNPRRKKSFTASDHLRGAERHEPETELPAEEHVAHFSPDEVDRRIETALRRAGR